MHRTCLKTLSNLLHRREISSQELTGLYLERAARYNPVINAFITLTTEHAMEAALAADQRLHEGTAGPLTGIPVAHKDIFCTDGIRTSCGSRMLDNFPAPYNATVVERLQDAGMVMIGKTNMDEFAMGSSSENSYYGPVKNPWDTGRVPGGSSGGSAAAIAAGMAPVTTGTDTGGSIRQPAALCGVTGLKPTYGRVSRYGMIAFASSLDQGGPITHTAEDAAMILNVMCGFDPRDSTSADHPREDFTGELNRQLDGLRVGLPREFFDSRLDPGIGGLIRDAIRHLEQSGARLMDIDLPHSALSIPVYYVVAMAECSSNLSRYDGVRFGYRCSNPENLLDLYCRSRGEGFGDEVKRRIMIGTYVLSAGYFDAYYLQAQKVRRLIRDDYRQAFNTVDVIIGPTTPSTAFKLHEKTADPVSMYLSDIYTVSVNLAGLPAISIPAGFLNGLPVGMQIIGNHFSESRLLNLAHRFQLETNWHLARPGAYA